MNDIREAKKVKIRNNNEKYRFKTSDLVENKNHINDLHHNFYDKNIFINSDILEGEILIKYSASNSSRSVYSNSNGNIYCDETPEFFRKISIRGAKTKINVQKEIDNKKYSLTFIAQSNKKLKRNPLSQAQTSLLKTPLNSLCGSYETAKIDEF